MILADQVTQSRQFMIDNQLRPGHVTDPAVLTAMKTVPREVFAAHRFHNLAYIDQNIPASDFVVQDGDEMQGFHAERYLLKPLVIGRLLQAAQITQKDTVLVVGCGRGYCVALISTMAAQVYGTESIPALGKEALLKLHEMHITNTPLHIAPLREGWLENAPYNVILIDGSVEEVPDSLTDQLAEGGRLLTLQAAPSGQSHARLYLKTDGIVTSRILFEAQSFCFQEFKKKKEFVF